MPLVSGGCMCQRCFPSYHALPRGTWGRRARPGAAARAGLLPAHRPRRPAEPGEVKGRATGAGILRERGGRGARQSPGRAEGDGGRRRRTFDSRCRHASIRLIHIKVTGREPLSENPERDELLSFFKAMMDANRLKIVARLAGRELSVGQIAEMLGLNASTVSHHLARLSKAGQRAGRGLLQHLPPRREGAARHGAVPARGRDAA